MGWRGILTGALVLVALEAIVQPDAAGRVGGLFRDFSKFAQKLLDPTRPAISAKPKESKEAGSLLGGLSIPGLASLPFELGGEIIDRLPGGNPFDTLHPPPGTEDWGLDEWAACLADPEACKERLGLVQPTAHFA